MHINMAVKQSKKYFLCLLAVWQTVKESRDDDAAKLTARKLLFSFIGIEHAHSVCVCVCVKEIKTRVLYAAVIDVFQKKRRKN